MKKLSLLLLCKELILVDDLAADKEYAFPEGHANAGEVYHVDSDPQPISDVLDIEHGIKYDFDTKTWSLDDVAFLNPFCTEEQHTASSYQPEKAAYQIKKKKLVEIGLMHKLQRLIDLLLNAMQFHPNLLVFIG